MIEAEFGILYFLHSIHTPWLDVVMKNITHLGDSGIFWILTGLCGSVLKRRGRWDSAVFYPWQAVY